jgi:hypothetical protein
MVVGSRVVSASVVSGYLLASARRVTRIILMLVGCSCALIAQVADG